MYTVTIVAGVNSSINIQDPYPSEDKIALTVGPGVTKVLQLQSSQFDRIKPQLDRLVALSLLSYVAINGPASQFSNDSSVPGTTIKDALNSLSGGVTAASDLAFSAARDHAGATDLYLSGPDGIATDLAGFVLPWDCKIVGLSMGSDVAATWTLEVRKNNSATVIASLACVAAEKKYIGTLDVNINAGDELQLYCNGTAIAYPSGTVFVRRR